MQFSTNLPCGVKAVREYIEHRGESRLPMNVSAEADAAYIAEKDLKLGPVILKSWPVGTCNRCQGVIHNAPFLSNAEPGEFCSRECRDEGRSRTRMGRPKLTPKQRSASASKRLDYQRTLMRERRDPVLAEKSLQPTENANVTDSISAS